MNERTHAGEGKSGGSFVLEPEVLELHYGGWMALTKPETQVRIGVVGASEAEARTLFAASVARWKEIGEAEFSPVQSRI